MPTEVLAEAQRQRALLDAKSAGLALADSQARPATKQLFVVDAVNRYLRDVKMNKSAAPRSGTTAIPSISSRSRLPKTGLFMPHRPRRPDGLHEHPLQA